MSLLNINGWEIPVSSFVVQDFDGGTSGRNILGQHFYNTGFVEEHETFTVETPPMAIEKAKAIKVLTSKNNGDGYSFDSADLYSNRGLSIGGVSNLGATALFGAGGLSGGPTTYATLLTCDWTISFYRNSGGVWSHYVVRSDSAVYVDGALGSQTFLTVNAAGDFSLSAGDYDDLYWIPTILPEEFIFAWDETQAMPSNPYVRISGDALCGDRLATPVSSSLKYITCGLASVSFTLETT